MASRLPCYGRTNIGYRIVARGGSLHMLRESLTIESYSRSRQRGHLPLGEHPTQAKLNLKIQWTNSSQLGESRCFHSFIASK